METACFLNTYGLVLSGGQSSRMGRDKSLLQYYYKPQRYHVYDMLEPLCEKIFISAKKEQGVSIEPGYNFLADDERYNDIGPLAALLTAFEKFPDKNILLVGSDYPFLTVEDLKNFSAYCLADNAACFYNEAADIYEPLLAWYPANAYPILKKNYQQQKHSLKHFLSSVNAQKFYPENKNSMMSIDTPEAFQKALSSLKSS